MPENYCIAFRWALQLVHNLDLKTICSAITDVSRIITKATPFVDMATGTGVSPPLIVFCASRAVQVGGMISGCVLFTILATNT
jgi:hypothetical protein